MELLNTLVTYLMFATNLASLLAVYREIYLRQFAMYVGGFPPAHKEKLEKMTKSVHNKSYSVQSNQHLIHFWKGERVPWTPWAALGKYKRVLLLVL